MKLEHRRGAHSALRILHGRRIKFGAYKLLAYAGACTDDDKFPRSQTGREERRYFKHTASRKFRTESAVPSVRSRSG